jgi:dephospho-CoA kinase
MNTAPLPRGGPYLVAVTGGIGSGKSTVADRFAARGIVLVDADLIAHQMTAPNGPAMPRLIETFGPGIRAADGSMDRAEMRSRVFKDPAAREQLESILHPMIRAESDRQIREAGSPYVMLVIPLLVETGGGKGRSHRILVVDCPEETQIARVISRSQLPRAQVESIMKAQATRAQRLAVANDVIDNSGGAEALEPQVQRLHEQYLRYSQVHRQTGL